MRDGPLIVLIHGAWYGGWCWERVGAQVRAAGLQVVAPDLPGRPGNPLPLGQVTAEAWTEDVGRLVAAARQPVVLVGHSLGGVTITNVAEAMPDRVRAVVFVAAFLLRNGESATDVMRADVDSDVRRARVLSADGESTSVLPEEVGQVLCGDCIPVDAERLAHSLVAESIIPARTPVRWTEGRFGGVPRYYVECTRDRVISRSAQQRMQRHTPCEETLVLPTGHAPFMTRSEKLAAFIGRVTARI